ncbi:hypothetical protein FEM48_Zijuj09G0009000 [Ziziphus jujuba var. spinosa]|uniref:Protein NIM1-INTERACTING 1-like n=1 Tax=Ziziphus jujuba var. spinosa TaxID=714518 RepID=A0A978UPZ0_ZIZJJ|nr:hypothetical protein FEM48_Zijuj09G0009000 [Ziziphus jujuba var. spinosa]
MGDDKINIQNGCSGEDAEEEMKIERFFALIRSFREARNRCRRREELYDQLSEKEKEKKKMKREDFFKLEDQKQSNWIPSFEREDFTTQVEFLGLPQVFPPPCPNFTAKNHHHPKQPVQDHALDLKLSL